MSTITTSDSVAIFAEVVNHLDLHNAVFIGHSTGGGEVVPDSRTGYPPHQQRRSTPTCSGSSGPDG
jgi:hypothetical protein